MWEGIFGFLAGFFVATIILWSALSRRAKIELKQTQELLRLESELRAIAEQQSESAVKMADAQATRANDYFGSIEGVVKERTAWSERYQSMVLSAGNAQDMMMRTIDNLCRQLEKAGKKVEMPKIIKAVRAEFVSEFGGPPKEGVEKPQPKT